MNRLALLISLFIVWASPAMAQYPITSCNEFNNIGSVLPLNGNYFLANDIDCAAVSGFFPKGNLGNAFIGTFDGRDLSGTQHVIRNLSFTVVSNGGGVFGVVGNANPGTIRNVVLEDVAVHGATVSMVGGLVGQLVNGTVDNCEIRAGANGSVVIGDTAVGGLVGSSSGVISNSLASVDVFGTSDVGGIVGFASNPTRASPSITNTRYLGKVSATGNFAGGFAGRLEDTVITGSSVGDTIAPQESVSGDQFVGGFVGGLEPGVLRVQLTDVEARALVTGTRAVGGMIGGSITGFRSQSDILDQGRGHGTISGNGFLNISIGGLIGIAREISIGASFADASVTGGDNVGGLIGRAEDTTDVIDSYATGTVTASGDNAGGLIGNVVSGVVASTRVTIDRTYSSGTVGAQDFAGGLIGLTAGAPHISSSFSVSAVVTAANPATTGGLIGDLAAGAVLTNNFWDQNATNRDACFDGAVQPGILGECERISSPGYFFLASHPPLAQWAIGGTTPVWMNCNTISYPVLGYQYDPAEHEFVFQGRVVDATNTGIPGVEITLTSTGATTVSDDNGNFVIPTVAANSPLSCGTYTLTAAPLPSGPAANCTIANPTVTSPGDGIAGGGLNMVSVTFTADCAITPELIGDLRFRISEEGLLTGRVSFTDVEDPPQALPDTCKLILYGRSTVTENGEVRKGPIHEIFNERFPDLSREMRFRAQLPLVERLEDGTRPVLHLIAALESCDPQSARQLSNVFARLMTCGNTDERISRDEWFERLPAALGITRCELVPSDASLECTEIKAAKRHRLKRKQKKKKKTAIVIPRIRRSFRYHTR